jgi:hypothetical protein
MSYAFLCHLPTPHMCLFYKVSFGQKYTDYLLTQKYENGQFLMK